MALLTIYVLHHRIPFPYVRRRSLSAFFNFFDSVFEIACLTLTHRHQRAV